MNHKEVAQRIADALGEGNLTTAAHCATRLRLVVKDYDAIDQVALDDDPDLKGTFKANNQYQIIVGPGDVNHVYDELVKITGATAATTTQAKEVADEDDNTNPIMKIIKVLSDIFVPLIPALTAGGLLMALNNIMTAEGLFGAQSLVQMYPSIADLADIINMFASAAFAFLPILIGFSATKRFGGNEYLGAVAGMILVMPQLINGYDVSDAMASGTMEYWNIFGINIAKAGYQGQVLPVIGVAWILATLEKFFHKILKNAVDFTFTPMLSVILTGFITFAFVGPVLRNVSDAFTNSLVWLIDTTGGLGFGIFGTFYSPIVLTGMHQSFPAIETTLLADIAKTGGDFIFPVASAANVAQGAAALAVFFLTKNEKEKGLASSSSLSAMLGITEPAMFGVNLKHRFPFYCAMIASGIASIILGIFGVRGGSLGPAGLIGFVAIIPKHIPMYMVSLIVSVIISFVLTYVYGRRYFVAQEADAKATEVLNEAIDDLKVDDTLQANSDSSNVFAPVSGMAVDLTTVNDEVFSSGVMGGGIAIKPNDESVYSPVNGTVTVTNESGHAYGLQSDDGTEVLIHIGIDTVQMNGDGFNMKVTQGQKVKKGDLLGIFNIEKIKAAGYDDTVMIIVTNSYDYNQIKPIEAKSINHGDKIIEVIK